MTGALAAALLASLLLVPAAGSHGTREGGTFRITLGASQFDSVDPALAYGGASWLVLNPVCATLMTYPSKPPPAGYRIVTDVAKSFPRASKDMRTWTFTLRSGFRFSDGTPLRASAFARAIHRTLDPDNESPATAYTQGIVGAKDVLSGKARTASGVVARGNTLTIRFEHPVPDFPAQTTMPFFCAVPPTLPVDPEGIGAFPSAGPYFVSEYRADERIVIDRNPHYGGSRPHHVDRFLIDLRPTTPDEMVDAVERGEADWGRTLREVYLDPARGLARKYGINRSRFWIVAGLGYRGYSLNTSRALFRDNVELRQAVNYAIDRSALEGGGGRGEITDQYLPSRFPGFEDAKIYPPQPDLKRARTLARGNTRSGKAVLYTLDISQAVVSARVVKRNLARIGLNVTVKALPQGAFFARAGRRGEPVDIVFSPWTPDYIDPFSYLNLFFDGRYVGFSNWSRLDEPAINLALRKAATLQGPARSRAYARLDTRIARDFAPMAATTFLREPTLVSARVGCVVVRPELDLTSVCLK